MNPSTAFATTFADELVRCGLREAVIAPGSRSAPLAIALWQQADSGRLRLHVRVDERSAAFLALGLAKAGGRPAAVLCTSGTAAANFHPAVVEADESGVPLLVLTADRPPELRGTGSNQTIDQLKLFGTAVRWFAEAGVPEARPGMNAYWRSLACRAWTAASGAGGTFPGPVHVNLPLREPLVPGLPDAMPARAGSPAEPRWPGSLAGRPGGAPWTTLPAGPGGPGGAGVLELPWAERGVIVAGDGAADPGTLLDLAAAAGWPILAEPSSGARQGRQALAGYQYLLDHPGFCAAHGPELVICAGRPGLSRGQLAFLRRAAATRARQVMLTQGPGRWADPARTGTDVAAAVHLAGAPGPPPTAWLDSWRQADAAASQAAGAILDAEAELTEPRLARDLAAALPDGALLWAASSLPVRDLDRHLPARAGLRVLASRGASGIDGLVSAAAGAALAHQAAGGGPAAALLGDLALLHDASGLFAGPAEPRPDLVLVIASNDGGGIFSSLEQAALPAPFERVFGTPHGARMRDLAAAAGIPHTSLRRAADLPGALGGRGIRIAELASDRAAGADLRARLGRAAAAAIDGLTTTGG
jgi:2-succinyl-5-enolpyruvyl-6-hydroxy-3-cyclohexene-1-carboxylate synthase